MSKKPGLSLLQWLAIVFVIGLVITVVANYLR